MKSIKELLKAKASKTLEGGQYLLEVVLDKTVGSAYLFFVDHIESIAILTCGIMLGLAGAALLGLI